MTDETLDSIARDLVAVPPRRVDPDVLAQADRDELAAALRRAVADLPSGEQRARLAAAFAAMTPSDGLEGELVGAATQTPFGAARPEDRPRVSPATVGLLALRPFTAVKAGALAGVVVIALLVGVLAGVVTDDDPVENLAVPGAAQQPIGVLQPVGHGATPPTDDQVAAMLPPDPADQIEAAEAAAAADPDMFEEEGIDPADTALVLDPNFDPYVSGYVDDPGGVSGPSAGDVDDPDAPDDGVRPSEPSPDDGGTDSDDPGDSGGDSGDDGSDAGDSGDAGDGPDGDSGDDSEESDDGALVDLCAGDLPPVECDGVGGTVTLAIVRPFAFLEDPIAFTTWPSCVGENPELADDEFVLHVATNNLGTFDVRYRIAGSSDEFQELTGATDELWREVYDPETRIWTNTCMVATRPTQEATQLELEITGVGDGDSGTATFRGVIDLDIAATGVRRQDRPDVRVEAISASEFDVYVPVGDDERAEVTLVQRDPAGRADCDAPVVAEGDQRTLARAPGTITLNPGWRDTLFRITATDPGYFAICVLWTDTFEPPTEIERAMITLDVPEVATTTFLYARYDQNACLGGGCPSTPLVVVAQVTPVGGETCYARMYKGGYRPDSPIEMCTIGGVPDRLLLTTLSGFSKNGDLIRYDGEQGRVEAAFDPTCERTTCTTWYSVPVRAPGGFFDGNGGIVGRALVGVRVNGGSGEVGIGSETPQSVDDDTSVDGPRLDWRSVRVRLDESDPARSVIVDWTSDRPVTMRVEASDTSYLENSCPVVRRTTAVADTRGTVRLSGLCPGTRHYVSFLLTDEAGNSTSYNALHRPFRGGIGWVQQSAPIMTERLSAVYEYRLEFAEYERGTRREITGKGVIPTLLYLELPQYTALDYQQLYYGEPYFGLECADPSHFDQSGSGIPVELSGATFGVPRTEFQLQTYRPSGTGIFDTFDSGDRVCPSSYSQARHVPTVDDLTCYFSLRDFIPQRDGTVRTNDIGYLLDGGEGVWVASADSRCTNYNRSTTLEARLTIRLRPT